MDELDIYIGEDGSVQHVYDDALADLFDGDGAATTQRASHVEPHPTRPGWLADMRPVGGPVLGRGWVRTPEAIEWSLAHDGNDGVASLPAFATRADALAAERAWLEEQLKERDL